MKRQVLSRETEEKCHADPIYRNLSFLMDREVSRAVENQNARNSYRGAIERCPQQINFDGSRSYRASRNFLNGSSSCREAIEIESQESRWIEIAITLSRKEAEKAR